MSAITLREPSLDDAAAITALINAHAAAVHGEADLDEEEIRHWFTFENLWMRVAERDGRIDGYADLEQDSGDPERWDIDARALDAAVNEALLAAAEEHARGRATGPVKLRAYAAASDQADRAALVARGFAPIRSSFQMRIELQDAVPPPEWPEGITVRTMREGEEQEVYEANQASFADHWGYTRPDKRHWRQWGRDSPRFDPTLWFIAEDAGEIAGISLCSVHHSGDPQFGWVGSLGVLPPWRRRGLGLALLRHSFAEFKRRGATRVGLGVDAENVTGAVRLYERAGMSVVRRSDTWEKVMD